VVRRRFPEVGIVLLTSYADPRLVGAKLSQVPDRTEYMRKQDVRDIEMLRSVIRRAAFGSVDRLADVPAVDLTDMQIETMRLIAQGLNNAEIARQRVVTERAVEQSINRIVRSLGYGNDSSLNRRALIIRAYYELTGSGNAPNATSS
jgi:hypothetical protein